MGAALINAVRCAGKQMKDITVVINGAGAAGIAIGTFLLNMGIGNLIMVDINGIINKDDKYENPAHAEIATKTNNNNIKGGLSEAMKGADVFIGVSKPGLVSEDMIKSMAEKPIVFAMANPEPEIMPDKALAAGAYIVGTGRSDFPNQINNVLAFPGIFRGALDVRASDINEEMKIAAAKAIASLVSDDELNPDYILPAAFIFLKLLAFILGNLLKVFRSAGCAVYMFTSVVILILSALDGDILTFSAVGGVASAILANALSVSEDARDRSAENK